MNSLHRPVAIDADSIDRHLSSIAEDGPGAVVAVALHGRIAYCSARGLANIELPAGLTPSMRLRIGSITKQMTCFAYLMLCEGGKASLDDDIAKHLPDYPHLGGISVRQLMGHTSGILDAHDICFQFGGLGREVASAELLSVYRSPRHSNFAAGASRLYNNGAYLLLSAIIEKLTDAPLEEALQRLVFRPFGMGATMLRRSDYDFAANSATLHAATPSGGFDKARLGAALAGEGGAVSTAEDMLAWLTGVEARESAWAAMREPVRLASGASTSYGLGVNAGDRSGLATYFHSGGVLGGSAIALKIPAIGLDLVALLNRDDITAADLAEHVLIRCSEGLGAELPTEQSRLATGLYYSSSTGRLLELSRANGLQRASIDGASVSLAPDANGELRSTSPLRWNSLAVRPKTEGTLLLEENGCRDTFHFQRSEQPSHSIEGCYSAVEAGVDVSIASDARGVTLAASSPFGSTKYALTHRAGLIWSASMLDRPSWSAALTFDDDARGFSFTTARTRRLRFRRLRRAGDAAA